MKHAARFLLLVSWGCVAAPTPMEERGSWTSVDWPDLRPVQCALAQGHQDEALRLGQGLDASGFAPPERM
jgi:hypothetical protein